jgi:hypothetical protein
MFFPCFPAHRRAGGAAILPIVTLAALLGTGSASAGPLTNGDFSAGFDGWSGQVIACDDVGCINQTTTQVGADVGETPFAALPNNYAVAGGTATLTTSFNFPSDPVYDVSLTQVFAVDALMGRATSLLLHYVLGIELSNPDPLDPFGDFATAFLGTTDKELTVLLVPGAGTLDITAFAGREVQLTFGITDFDGVADSLTISGLAIERVPLPGTVLLLLTGLGLIARRRIQPVSRTAC